MSSHIRRVLLAAPSFAALSFATLCFAVACSSPGSSNPGLSSDGGDDAGSQLTDSGPSAPGDGGQPAGQDAGPRDAGPGEHDAGPGETDAGSGQGIQTVFLILEENHNWSDIKGNSEAPYINSLLALGAHAEAYDNLPGIHPSEPNYLWIEAGTNFGILADGVPATDHQSTTAHLVTQLDNAGISWKSYQEDISGTDCPLTAVNNYAPKHNPMVYFDDITNTNSSSSSTCLAHVRPYTELAGDLTAGTVARYNFITPNLCDDMHTACGATGNELVDGDNWLKAQVPLILASSAYKNGGVLFITWDESEGGDFPIGFIALSPFAKVNYSNTIPYSHSSLLRSNQEIFKVSPFLGGAAGATDLSDLFTHFP